MPKGGGGGGSTTTSTTPWKKQQPYLLDIWGRAQDQSNVPEPFYPDQTYAPFSPETMGAMGLQDVRALTGSPVTASAQEQEIGTLGGSYLSAGNPYFSNMVSNIQKAVEPALAGRFEGSGRYGSPGYVGALSSAMVDETGKLAYQNYADERQNQIKAMLFAPELAQQDYFDIAKLAEVGGMKEDQTQRGINEAMQRFAWPYTEPWQRLGQFSNLVQGMYGGQSQTTENLPGTSLGQGLLGGASSLGGLGLLAYSLLSDPKTKTKVRKFEDGLGLINSLRPVSFDYKDEYGPSGQVGFMADELEKVAPGMVFEGDDGHKRIMPWALLAPLVGAVQEQQKQIDELRV